MDFVFENMVAINFIHLDNARACEVLEARNAASEFMLTSRKISKKEHFAFINSLKTNKNRAYFAVYENDYKGAESATDSAFFTPSTQEANYAIADEFLRFCEASDEDRTLVHQGSEPKQSLKSRCESEFAIDSATFSQNLWENQAQIAESDIICNSKSFSCNSKSLPCHSERSEESKKNLILSKAKYLKNPQNRDSSPTAQNDNATLLGVVCFNSIDLANKNAFFGIYSNGNNNGAKLLQILRFLAFERLNLHILYAKVISTNARAIRFYEKNGFVRCGRLIDALMREGKFIDLEIWALKREFNFCKA